MVGSRVDGSNVLVAMHNYHGCACNVGHGNGNAQPSWMVGSKEVVVIHTHRGCTVMFIANHGRGNRIGNVGHRCYTCNAGHVDNDRHLLNQGGNRNAQSSSFISQTYICSFVSCPSVIGSRMAASNVVIVMLNNRRLLA